MASLIQFIADMFRGRRPNKPHQTEYQPAPDHQLLAGQTAWVSGAAGLIGSAIVSELLAQGARVKALDKNEQGLANLSSNADDDRLETVTLDLTNPQNVADLELGACDLLVHAAGIQFEANVLRDSDEQWGQSLDTNVAGPVRLTRALLSQLIERKGSIIVIGSIHAEHPSRWANYSAAKAAQVAMMREWAVDLAPHGVRVNAVAPGWTSEEVKTSKLALLHQQTIPPEYIARAVTMLASDYYSRFTTGSVVTVDAGASLYSGRVPFDHPTGGTG